MKTAMITIAILGFFEAMLGEHEPDAAFFYAIGWLLLLTALLVGFIHVP